MNRFFIINNKNFAKELISLLNYHQVFNNTGGDNDFICIDYLNKEYCWIENGTYPFAEIDNFQNSNVKLKDLIKMKYE